ncbi:transglycosylase domain-containing protein [Paenibacillus camelliae]|uniref:transglycosylase domain-containing protein n=1 Tax=Paenibacillus camelliae TaxID=512410 RepID=UPI00203D5BA7|nr:PBP1A family penicillin-binding protein [Paenibacillus camelliae]MCM3632857.1 PBP1A family penicillin-binding protein [Paenibacillus camelliae]
MSEYREGNANGKAQDRGQQSGKTKQKPRKKKKNKGKIWFYSLFFAIVFGIVAAILGYSAIIINGERILDEHGHKLNFGEASIIYDSEGIEIARLVDVNENREIAEFSEIPKVVLDAFVATEDKRFYEHSGLDFISIGRAVVKDIIARSAVEGGSTITQQLAKNVFLSADKTIFRKATEASIAVALENQMSKEQILSMYLNRIYYGKGIHGIKSAAEYYFDTELEDLELWQAATLAAMPKAPNRYNPINNPEASFERRAVVLQLMYDQGYITEQQMNEAKTVEYVQPDHAEKYSNSKYTAFIDYVVEEAIEMTGLSEEELRVGGFHIYTTIDTKAQDIMDAEFANAENFEESVDDQLAQGAMIIMDHSSGEIKAMAAGRDYVKKGWNRVTKKRQPGSSYKPLIAFGPALEHDNLSPSSILNIDRTCFGDYCPRDKWGATPVTMQLALQESRNLAAVWLLNEVGFKKANEFATKLGVGLNENEYNLSSALGGLEQGFSPLEMATAYSVIANDGMSVDPHTIRSIKGNNYSKEYSAPKAERLMKESTAAYLTQMLQAVVEAGTAKRAQIDRPVAGKTGTTQHGIPGHKGSENRDVWFVGYTPEWTAAVWMGYDNTDKDHLLKKGSSQATSLFAKVMKPALASIPKQNFTVVEEEVVEPPSIEMGPLSYTYDEMNGIVTLDWSINYEGDVTFEVFRMEQNSGSFTHFAETEGTLTIQDMSVFPGYNYQYYVVAHDLENEISSAPSNTISIDIPDGDFGVPELPMDGDNELPEDEEWVEGNPYPPTDPTPTPPVEELPQETAPTEPTPPVDNPEQPTEPTDSDTDGQSSGNDIGGLIEELLNMEGNHEAQQ